MHIAHHLNCNTMSFLIMMRSTGRTTSKGGYFVYEITSNLSSEQIEILTKMNNGYSLQYREKLYWNLPIHPTDPTDLTGSHCFIVRPDYVWEKSGRIGAVFHDPNYAARLASYQGLKKPAETPDEESEF